MFTEYWCEIIKQRSAVGDHEAVANLIDGVKEHVDLLSQFDEQWKQTVEGAITCGVPIEITRGQAFQLYHLQGGKCALSGLPIRFHQRRHGATWTASNDASLDQIEQGRGYVPGNVWWLHRDVGRMKLDLPLPRFLELCRLIVAREATGAISPPLDPTPLTAPPVETSTPELIMGRYLRDRIEPDRLHRETAAALWQSFRDWCRVTGAQPFTQTAFGRALRSHGYESKRGHVVTWSGLRLVPCEGERV